MKKLIFSAMLSVAVAGFAAVIEKGNLELGLQGNMDFSSPDGDVEFNIYPSLGYFLSDNIQAGGILGMVYDGSDMGYRIGGFGEVNFDTYNAIMPFLALRLMLDFGSYYAKSYVLVDSAAGLKFFLSQKLVIAMEIFYDLASEDAAFPGEEGSGSSNDSGLRLGLRHYF
ncbi:MAG: hypothetical protein ACOYCD_04415 [Kiritimatiellia bacterium]|jgi:hypothetical protein